jgi:DNA (cytosine-5)-methyltransferase 1
MALNCVELFAGAGGLGLGLKKAGINVALAVEIEKDFANTYSLNHNNTKVIAADINSIDLIHEVSFLGFKKIDILAGGPPCQGFSTVGSKISNDPRNSLVFSFLNAAKLLNPDYILFENVSGFKKLYSGFAYETLINQLKKFDYRVVSAILEGADYGLPQRRQRTIVVASKNHLKKVNLPSQTHTDGGCMFGTKPWIPIIDAISDLPPLNSGDSKSVYHSDPKNDYQNMMRSGVSVLTEHNASSYGPKMMEILRLVPPGGCVSDLPKHLRPKSYFPNTYARLVPNFPSPTITRNFGTPSSSRCIHPFQNRALSTREGARLQGFPDNYIFFGGKTSKNLQIGNAVPPIFGELLAKSILNSL